MKRYVIIALAVLVSPLVVESSAGLFDGFRARRAARIQARWESAARYNAARQSAACMASRGYSAPQSASYASQGGFSSRSHNSAGGSYSQGTTQVIYEATPIPQSTPVIIESNKSDCPSCVRPETTQTFWLDEADFSCRSYGKPCRAFACKSLRVEAIASL
ncbi:MAG: hypothetical protein AAF449_12495 [Myxococcota bacterium]